MRWIVCPLMKRAYGPTRKRTRSAMSCGTPRRPRGIFRADPAALGAPLSAKNDVLTVIPGPLDADTMKQRLADADAAAIIKVGRHFDKIRGVIDALGLAENARYIERATMAEQRIVPLADVGDHDAPYFSMILVHKRKEAWK